MVDGERGEVESVPKGTMPGRVTQVQWTQGQRWCHVGGGVGKGTLVLKSRGLWRNVWMSAGATYRGSQNQGCCPGGSPPEDPTLVGQDP